MDPVPVELIETFARRWSARLRPYTLWYTGRPPTARSIYRIGRKLGVPIPPLLVEVVRRCPEYGAWFGGLGDDYSHPCHILANNHSFHEMGLPARYVIINQGFDGDCDCWDLNERPVDGELPIKYVSLTDHTDGDREWYELSRVVPYAANMLEYLRDH